MGKITNRDMEVIRFLDESKVIMTGEDIAKKFYMSNTSNLRSAITIAQRRLRVMVDAGYIKQKNREFGEPNKYYSVYLEDDQSELNEHQQLVNDFISNFCARYNVLNIKKEYIYFQSIFSLRPDIKIDFEYNGNVITAFIECDRMKQFTSLDKYTNLLKNIDKYKDELPNDIIIISCCKKQPKTNNICKPIHVFNEVNLNPIDFYLEKTYGLKDYEYGYSCSKKEEKIETKENNENILLQQNEKLKEQNELLKEQNELLKQQNELFTKLLKERQ